MAGHTIRKSKPTATWTGYWPCDGRDTTESLCPTARTRTPWKGFPSLPNPFLGPIPTFYPNQHQIG